MILQFLILDLMQKKSNQLREIQICDKCGTEPYDYPKNAPLSQYSQCENSRQFTSVESEQKKTRIQLQELIGECDSIIQPSEDTIKIFKEKVIDVIFKAKIFNSPTRNSLTNQIKHAKMIESIKTILQKTNNIKK